MSKTALQRWSKAGRSRVGAFHHVEVDEGGTGTEAEPLVVVFPSGARIGVSWEQVRQLLGVSA